MDLEKVKALEVQLSQLKAEQEAGTKSPKEYIAEVQKLEFVDETTKDTWRLNSEDGLWYVAAAGSKQLKLAKPQPGKVEDAPVAPVGTSEEGSPISTSEPPEKVTTEPREDAPFSGRQNTSTVAPMQPDSGFGAKFLIVGLGIAATLIIVLFVVYRLIGSSGGNTIALNTPTPTAPATSNSLAGSTALPTQPPTDIPTATPIVSQPEETETPSQIPTTNPAPPTDELTSTPLPSSTVAPTFTPSPTDTPVPQPIAEVIPVEESTGVISGKLAYAYFDPVASTFVVEVKDLLTSQQVFTKTQASQPALTSDGSRLAYHSWQPDRVGLYAVALDNSASQNTLSIYPESHRPQWGLDNQSYLFTYLKQVENDDTVIKTIQFSDNDPPLLLPGFGLTGAWGPGFRVVLNTCEGSKCGLAVVSTNGTGLIFLTDQPDDLSPAVSPDGQWIAYTSQHKENWDIYLISINGGEPKPLTNQPGRDGIPAWSPDGKFIAYASQQNGIWSIWVVKPDGQEAQKLFDLPGSLEGTVPAFPGYTQPGWLFENLSWSR